MPTNTYVALDKVTVGTATAAVTFSSISSAYTDLVVVAANLVATSGNPNVGLTFNGDTASNYSATILEGTGSSAQSARKTNTTLIVEGNNVSLGGTNPSTIIYNIMNYSNTTTYKTALLRNSELSTTYPGTGATVGLWRSTAAITSVTLTIGSGNFAVGSTFSLYGISTVGDATPKATGGDVTSDATYWYHAFTMSGNFIPNQTLSCDYLILAGGGGGGSEEGGGGGAGGFRTFASQSLTAQTYQVLVGGGGTGGVATGTRGTSGTNSTFNSASSTGGGGGGTNSTKSGLSGGSGGGTGNSSGGTGGAGNAGSYSPVEGFAGGTNSSFRCGSGGGGASAVGTSPASSSSAGVGGAGTASSLSGTSITYAGGGGGGQEVIGNAGGAGGAGGGGTGGSSLARSQAGTTNLGGGGGGGASSSTGVVSGANGGSGIVIVRYAK
jgi:hypothetical protein